MQDFFFFNDHQEICEKQYHIQRYFILFTQKTQKIIYTIKNHTLKAVLSRTLSNKITNLNTKGTLAKRQKTFHLS